jgi:streptomycin 6-kinase
VEAPAALARNLRETFGARGAAFLDDLAARIAAQERRWGITAGPAFPGRSSHWVAPATRSDGTLAVLKLGVPHPGLTSEIETLRAWDGRGAARLLESDAAEGALLLERLRPGTLLSELGLARDDEATTIAAALFTELHAPPPPDHGLPTLAARTDGILRAQRAGFAPALIGLAADLRQELLASAPAPVLLHGDLHHFNVLRAERRPWLAIDPKGVVGDPAYDAAPFLWNPISALGDAPDRAAIVARRIDRLAEHLDRARLVRWALVQSVLSAWWSVEDHGGGFEPALEFARLIEKMI